jgi:hypothetical protein
MRILALFPFIALAAATPLHPRPHHNVTSPVKCPIIFDGRIPSNLLLSSFDNATSSPFNPDFVKGENRTWSSVLLLPYTRKHSRFDEPHKHKAIEVTIDDGSLFRAGDRLQVGFRRAGLLLKDDQNDEGADASDKGIITFHWSIMQDPHRPLNLSHEYMNVWHERSDYNGNQFTFVGGVVLPGDGGTGVDTPAERKVWKIQNFKNEFIFQTPILFKGTWQNFAVQLDHTNSCVQPYYRPSHAKLTLC